MVLPKALIINFKCFSIRLCILIVAILNNLCLINYWYCFWTLPMAQESWVQSQVESYQRLKNGT